MKLTLSACLALISSCVFAQEFSNTNLQAMVDTERAFSKMAKDQNRKDAFLFYLSDDVITSGPDGPIIGKTEIEKQPVTNDWLHWEVAFCDIVASGDFGYNTGPYEYRVNKTDEKPVGYGQFNSVWKKQTNGVWKNVLDLGTRHGATNEKTILTTSARLLKSKKIRCEFTRDNFLEIEKMFLKEYQQNKTAAYKKYLSSEARIVHSGKLPIINTEEKEKFVEESTNYSNMHGMGGDVAASKDLGYAYGTLDISLERNGKSETRKATYVRIWKKEDGKNWKIVLDVLSY